MTDELHGSVRSLSIRYYAYLFVKNLNLWAPIYILFVMNRGFSLAEATLLSSVWWLTAVGLEVPTGILADRWGKKPCLLLSSFSLVAAFITLFSAHTFVLIAIAYILWAVAVSLASGTDNALLYDSLVELRAEGAYRSICGRAFAIAIAASGIGALIGGLVGEIDLAYPILISAALALGEIGILLAFREPRVTAGKETLPLTRMEFIRANVLTRALWGVIAVDAVIYTTIWVLGVFYQPHLRALGFSVSSMGFLYFFFKLIGAAGSYTSAGLGKRLGEYRQMFLLPLLLACTILSISYGGMPWGIIFIAITFFLNGSSGPLISTIINQRVESRYRATVLSLNSLVGSLVLVPVQPLMGVYAEQRGLRSAFTLVGCFVLLGGLLAYHVSRLLADNRKIAVERVSTSPK